ncbi:MAG: hypothetical protein P1U84_12115 [Parvibaculaceae bacterium]|nr:hypothetical protein [Parvibaculaceae bacterium]
MKTEVMIDWRSVERERQGSITMKAHELFLAMIDMQSEDVRRVLALKRSKERMEAIAAGFPEIERPLPKGMSADDYRKLSEATHETRVKRRSDVCLSLVNRGVIDHGHLIIVEEIRDVVDALRLSTTSNWMVERVDGGGKWADPYERMSERAGRVLRSHYLPWLASLADEPIVQELATRRLVYLCAAAFVRLVVVENYGIKQAEIACGIARDMGRGACLLRIALDRYVHIMQKKQVDQSAESCAFQNAA